MAVNFGNVSGDYAKYRDHLPSVLFDQLAEKGITFEGLQVIDLGSGTGIFSRDMAKRGARVIGVEPSQKLIDEAITYDKRNGIGGVSYIQGKAEDFTVQGSYSMITAVRAWHWFDRLRVLQNIKKVLKPQGLLIIINSIFLPDSDIAKTTFEVLKNHHIELRPAGSQAEAKEKRTGFPVEWFDEWKNHSLTLIHEWQHDYFLPFTHEEWCGKVRSLSWMTNVQETIRMKVTAELTDKLKLFNEMIQVPHRYSVVILKNECEY